MRNQPVKPREPDEPLLMQLIPEASSSDWTLLEQICTVLALAAELTTTAEGEFYSTLSLSMVLTQTLVCKLSNPVPADSTRLGFVELPLVKRFREALLRSVVSRLGSPLPIVLVACILDVRSKRLVDNCELNFTDADRSSAYQMLQNLVNDDLDAEAASSRDAQADVGASSASLSRSARARARQQGHQHMGGQLRTLDDVLAALKNVCSCLFIYSFLMFVSCGHVDGRRC